MSKISRRPLTDGEIALAGRAFGDGVDYRSVRICHGTGGNPGASIAFRNPHNDAITLVRTIFFRGAPVADFSKAGDPDLFMHEMTHIWQYQTLGILPFYWRYLLELEACDFRPPALYRYEQGATAFRDARLEAQAKMVQDYSGALRRDDDEAIAAIRRNLAGSGLFGQ